MWKMSVVLKPTAQLPENLPDSDFESTRREHIHKQVNFLITQVTDELETKFNIGYEYNYQNRWKN